MIPPRKRILPLTVILGLFMITASLLYGEYRFDFITVSDVVKKVKKRFGEIDSYQAKFSIRSTKRGKTRHQTGVLKYKSPNRLLIQFFRPSGQRIVSDGSMMWIYIPSMNVVAEQDLKSGDQGLFGSGTKSGLRRLFSKYHYRFDSKKQPTEANGETYYTLYLKQKESRSGYKHLKLWVNSDYMIQKAEGETTTGKHVVISFTDINTEVRHPSGIFKFDVPPRARVIKNPMISEE